MTKLIISKAGKKPLTKSQEAFNKLSARIEKLHKEIAKKQSQLDKALTIYSADIYPLRQKKLEELRRVFIILWSVYKSGQLSKTDQRMLKTILQDDLYDIFQLLPDGPDDELKKIFLELEGEHYETVLKREQAEIKEEMQEVLERMDVDIDLSDVEEEEDMARKMAEAMKKAREQEERREQQRQQRQKQKKKTAHELEKDRMQQAADELKHKNFSTIYRQLAKLFHPDLEQDEQRKAEKEELMKQLTAAYESKNLHELLSLELKWIHKETGHLESLTEEKLAVYLQILREQAKELEQEKYTILYHPRYSILMQEFGMFMQNPLVAINTVKKNLEEDIAELGHDAALFGASAGLSAVRQMIKEVKAARKHSKDEDLFSIYFDTK